jgi:hypothetical protein
MILHDISPSVNFPPFSIHLPSRLALNLAFRLLALRTVRCSMMGFVSHTADFFPGRGLWVKNFEG